MGTYANGEEGEEVADEEEATFDKWDGNLPTNTLRVRRMTLSWRRLGCTYVNSAGVATAVLQDVTGDAQPGSMLAVMGHSGSGKSTLLDMLAGRKRVGALAGEVLVDGVLRGSGFYTSVAYVPQEENLLPCLQVDETCQVYAALQLPRGTSKEQVAERIDAVLASMGMLSKKGQMVGGMMPGGILLRGLSGGERKRLWVAAYLLGVPSILFLDEPTTGLDSCAALSVITQLQHRTHASGLTTIASIHQPRGAIFEAFDSLCLLSGGRQLFLGPCSDARAWFEGELHCGPWEASRHGILSDWLMDISSIDLERKQRGSRYGRVLEDMVAITKAANRFAAAYAAAHPGIDAQPTAAQTVSHWHRRKITALPAFLGHAIPAADKNVGLGNGWAPTNGAAPAPTAAALQVEEAGNTQQSPAWWTRFRTLLWREWIVTIRNPANVAGRMLTFAYLSLICGLVFWAPGRVGMSVFTLRAATLFMETTVFTMLPFAYLTLYHADRQSFMADAGARLYPVSAYYAAKQLAVLPFAIVNTLCATWMIYGMAGLRNSPYAILTHGSVTTLLFLVAQQFHAVAVVVAPNFDTAYALTVVWTGINILVSNNLIRFTEMAHQWMRALGWISAMSYAWGAFLRIEFEGATHPCEGIIPPMMAPMARGLLSFLPKMGVPKVIEVETSPEGGCVIDASEVIVWFNFLWPTWGYVLALLLYLVVLHCMTYAALVWASRKEAR